MLWLKRRRFAHARSTGDRPEEERTPLRLVIDLNLGLLPNDPAEEVRRILGFWTAWLPKMDLTQPIEQELHDSNHQAVGMPRLLDADATHEPEAAL